MFESASISAFKYLIYVMSQCTYKDVEFIHSAHDSDTQIVALTNKSEKWFEVMKFWFQGSYSFVILWNTYWNNCERHP